MLDELDMMRGDDGMLDLKLVYPGTSLPDVRWKQSVNPAQRGASTLEGTFYTAVNKTVLWTKLFEQRGCTTAFDGTPTAVDAFFAATRHRMLRFDFNGVPYAFMRRITDFSDGPSKPSSLARFLPVSRYLLELASGVRVLECGVLTSPGA